MDFTYKQPTGAPAALSAIRAPNAISIPAPVVPNPEIAHSWSKGQLIIRLIMAQTKLIDNGLMCDKDAIGLGVEALVRYLPFVHSLSVRNPSEFIDLIFDRSNPFPCNDVDIIGIANSLHEFATSCTDAKVIVLEQVLKHCNF